MADSLHQPPIDVLPGHALRELTDGARPWEAEEGEVPPPLTALLWVLLIGAVGVGSWFGILHFGGSSCTVLPCAVATWGDRTLLLFGFAAAGVLGLGVGAWRTAGFRRTAIGPVALLTVSALAAFVALSGVIAVAMVAVVALVMVLGLLFLVLVNV
jgi:hypothetical protein